MSFFRLAGGCDRNLHCNFLGQRRFVHLQRCRFGHGHVSPTCLSVRTQGALPWTCQHLHCVSSGRHLSILMCSFVNQTLLKSLFLRQLFHIFVFTTVKDNHTTHPNMDIWQLLCWYRTVHYKATTSKYVWLVLILDCEE